MRYRAVGKRVGVSEFLRTFCGLGRRNAANFTGKLVQRLNRRGATLTAVRAADAVEAIAVEIWRQCECSGQLVSMAVINRALNQLRAHRPTCKCGLCGETFAKAKADRVYRTASVWQRSVIATRARATR
jgi:hypothetical protein